MRKCRRCGGPPDATKVFCPGCGLIQEPRSIRVHAPTDDSRGKALEEMRRGVDAGRAEFQRDVEQRFENAVYEHYNGI